VLRPNRNSYFHPDLRIDREKSAITQRSGRFKIKIMSFEYFLPYGESQHCLRLNSVRQK